MSSAHRGVPSPEVPTEGLSGDWLLSLLGWEAMGQPSEPTETFFLRRKLKNKHDMWGPKAGRGESRGAWRPPNPLVTLQGALGASLLHSQTN